LADTWTIGAVFQPSWLDGFAFSVDWFDIKIKDYITQLGISRIIDDCFAGAVELCARITRDSSSNAITVVENIFLNVAQARVQGIDMEASYRTPIRLFRQGGEDLSIRLFASFMDENSFTNVGVPKRDNAGTINYPEWTATGVVTYTNGPFLASVTGRYIDNTNRESEPVSLANQLDDMTIDSLFYTNLRLAYTFDTERFGSHRVFFNVANLFDVDPPVYPTWSDFFGAQSVLPGLHDGLGRRFTAGVEFEF
jgi:outer membrane receptor protein involved in Fe transport